VWLWFKTVGWERKEKGRGEEQQTAAVYIRNRLAPLAMAVAGWLAGTAGCGWLAGTCV
jgi:ABC-type uncharacterized transport system permease subunit